MSVWNGRARATHANHRPIRFGGNGAVNRSPEDAPARMSRIRVAMRPLKTLRHVRIDIGPSSASARTGVETMMTARALSNADRGRQSSDRARHSNVHGVVNG